MTQSKKRFLLVAFALAISQGWGTRMVFSREVDFSIDVPKVETPPKIEGRLDDMAWKQTPRGALAWTVKGERVDGNAQSQVMAVYDSLYLYVGFLNRVSGDNGLDWGQDQKPVIRDDRVEFAVDPGNMGKGSFFRIGVNRNNTTFLSWTLPETLGAKIRSGEILPELIPIALAFPKEREWKPKSLETATHSARLAWAVEIKVAFEDLLQSGAPVGQTWGVNFMRFESGPGITPTTWSKVGMTLNDPEKFGDLTFSR